LRAVRRDEDHTHSTKFPNCSIALAPLYGLQFEIDDERQVIRRIPCHSAFWHVCCQMRK